MPHANLIEAHGGPEVLQWRDVPAPAPGPGEVRLRQTAVGVNYLDIYHRIGLYPLDLPFIPGSEGAGIVDAVGAGVDGFAVGDRAVYQGVLGAYAESRVVPADKLVRLPDDIVERIAAAAFLKGLTAAVLLQRTFKVERGQAILWHAAAGGVGLIACQWAAGLGATVIGTVGSPEKAAAAKKAGCAHVINYREEDFVARVREITGGRGVDVVYDSVGKDTFPGSLDCLRPLGLWVAFGQSSGLPPPFQISLLQQKGSLYATRPTIFHYLATRAELEATAADLFQVMHSGMVKVEIGQEFPLKEAAAAHRALEGRRTIGSTLLIP